LGKEATRDIITLATPLHHAYSGLRFNREAQTMARLPEARGKAFADLLRLVERHAAASDDDTKPDIVDTARQAVVGFLALSDGNPTSTAIAIEKLRAEIEMVPAPPTTSENRWLEAAGWASDALRDAPRPR
jgi:uncharacterized alpha-E superfamily protein